MDIQRPQSPRPIPPDAKRVFKGKIFEAYQWEQELYDGTKTTFEKLKRNDSVNVFPITDKGNIIIARQEQPGHAPFWGCVGGRLDEDETPLDGAKRELKEETGYEADTYILWDSVQPSATVEWAIYTFIAKDVKKTSEPSPDAGEKIELHEVTFDEFIGLSRRPDYRDKEIALLIHRALGDPKKMEELRTLFSPSAL